MAGSSNCLTPKERMDYGVTAELANIATGELRLEVVRGGLTTKQATRIVCNLCDELGGDWKIRTLSSPVTIVSDLQNRGQERVRPEGRMLGSLGRMDLLEWHAKYSGLRVDTDYKRRRRDHREAQ